MRPTTDEKPGQDDRRAVERQATTQLTALTIFVLVLASIVGALLTIASEIAIREGPLHRAEALWVVATKGGILLFLTTVALLPYRVSLVGGVICSILRREQR